MKKPSQKYMEIVTMDNFEFWFMGFLNYQKASAIFNRQSLKCKSSPRKLSTIFNKQSFKPRIHYKRKAVQANTFLPSASSADMLSKSPTKLQTCIFLNVAFP
ncbi:GEM-like protein 6 [Vitis vinifera]|uniref:GEM-like protein 6 n=1 Tax=Vitis vinifera TaxID=29760 RepID=A0A438EUT6_VITVI|nr:GEM-like protein 6 [Vitis vinifera]